MKANQSQVGPSHGTLDDHDGEPRLRVGGLTPLTGIDYPGELAAVIFCQGCPWHCSYCHNGHLLPAKGNHLIPWSQVTPFLLRRQGLLDAVVFSGGEPTLQTPLAAAMAQVKALGFKIGLHTAGIYPERLARLIPYLDWVGLDIKALPESYPSITGAPGSGERAWSSLRLLMDAGTPLEVRTTLPGDWSLSQELEALMHRLAWEGVENYALQNRRDPISPRKDGQRVEFPAPGPSEISLSTGQALFRHFILR